jgi:hypothetical protein
MHKSLQAITPAAPRPKYTPHNPGSGPGGHSELLELPKRKRFNVRVACNGCRAKKSAVSLLKVLSDYASHADLAANSTSAMADDQPVLDAVVKVVYASICRGLRMKHQAWL